jgi:copper resistance protein B
MKKQIIAMTLSLLVSPLALAEMDHSKHQGMNMKMPVKQGTVMKSNVASTMDHSIHKGMPRKQTMSKKQEKHDMKGMKTRNSSSMNHKPTIPVSDGSLDHDVPLPYAVDKMEDDPILAKFMLEQLEVHDADGSQPLTWEGEAWIGKDINKLWLKTEGERVSGNTEELEVQALYSRAVAPYWDVQLGIRKDFKPVGREWGVIGLKGLAPYFFETDIALFVGDNGRTAARVQAEYELLLTQKTILTPEIEVNLYGKNDSEMRTGSGLSDITVGLRLRHEFKREFAPYIGVEWSKKLGNTADFARDDGEDVSDTQLVAGIRAWF